MKELIDMSKLKWIGHFSWYQLTWVERVAVSLSKEGMGQSIGTVRKEWIMSDGQFVRIKSI